MYQIESRIRFSETDGERKISPAAIVDYFQDCSTFQSEDLGVGFSYLIPQNLTWVLNYWQIIVEEYPSLGEKITIGTLPYDFKGFLGKRNFFIKKQGRIIAKADSLWTFMNLETMLPAKIPEEILKVYPIETKLDMDYLPRKIKVTGEEETGEPFGIQKYHLDCNHHVNNGQYIKMASSFLSHDFNIHQIRAEYRKQAHLGDMIYPYMYREENKIFICLCDEEKYPYVVTEFSEK